MMEEQGTVVARKEGIAKVEIAQKEACSSCAARTVCNPGGTGKIYVDAANNLNADVGDTVKIEISSGISFAAGLLMFIFPIIFFVIGLVIFRMLTGSDGAGLGGGFAFLIISFFILKQINKKISGGKKFKPVIKQIVEKGDIFIDPVCGMEVHPIQNSHKLEFQGKIYYFCSQRCKEIFEKSPGEFAG